MTSKTPDSGNPSKTRLLLLLLLMLLLLFGPLGGKSVLRFRATLWNVGCPNLRLVVTVPTTQATTITTASTGKPAASAADAAPDMVVETPSRPTASEAISEIPAAS